VTKGPTSTDEWTSALESGSRLRDPNAIAGLFTDDAHYHRGPFGEPHRGRDAIRAQWVETLSRQVDARLWFGSAIESAGRAAVESWAFFMIPRRASNGPHPVASQSDSDRTDGARPYTSIGTPS
jgi:SnoaL-like domain